MVKGTLCYISSSQELLVTNAIDFVPRMTLNIHILVVSATGHSVHDISDVNPIGLNLLVAIPTAILLANYLWLPFVL